MERMDGTPAPDPPVPAVVGQEGVDGRVLAGIYWGLTMLAFLQLVRVVLSKTRRLWSLQSAFLALCLGWTASRALYFSFVFEGSESCAGFSCSGGTSAGDACHPTLAGECTGGGTCVSNSQISCAGQHILFGLPTIIQSFMLSTLIVFYAYWIHKANGIICRRRVLVLVGVCNVFYYVCFGVWVGIVRCGASGTWASCSLCETAMSWVTASILFILSGAMAHFSWKLYVHAQRAPPSTATVPSGRRKTIWINTLIVVLFVSHGILSFLSLSPDRQDILPCPVLLFPHVIICIIGEVLPTLLLLLHFRRISRPSLSTSAGTDGQDKSGRSEPTRPLEAYTDLTSSSSDSEEEASESEGTAHEGTGGNQSLFSDPTRYEHNTHGIFQSSPSFVNNGLWDGRKARRQPLLGDD